MSNNTPFSFHCMICFEEFDPEIRFPVVLPCGHTYVCNACADRLDKCMECRVPLYTTQQQQQDGRRAQSTGALPHNQHWNSSNSRPHSRYDNVPHSPPPKPVKTRLPLPKNVVLLSLIDATELVTEGVQNPAKDGQDNSTPRNSNSDDDDDDMRATRAATGTGTPMTPLRSVGSVLDELNNDSVDEEEDEEEKIKAGTSLAVGVAGTYACAVRDGLDILPTRPSSQAVDASSMLDGDVDTLVRYFHMMEKDNPSNNGDASVSTTATTQKHGTNPLMNLEHSPKPEEIIEQMANLSMTTPILGADDASLKEGAAPEIPVVRLSFGDRVQVVSMDGGWAKLARGYGFCRCDKNQLVKVGGPVDRACKLEAMLRALSNKRKELRIEQSKVDNKFIRLMNGLQMSLQQDEDLTVICATIFHDSIPPTVDEEKDEETKSPAADAAAAADRPPPPPSPPSGSQSSRDATSQPTPSSPTSSVHLAPRPEHIDPHLLERNNSLVDLEKPARLERNPTPPEPRGGVSLVCFANNVFDTDDGESALESSRRLLGSVSHPFLGTSGTTDNEEQHTTAAAALTNPVSLLFPAASHPSPSEMRAGARAWREQNSAYFSENRVGVGNGHIDFRTGMSGHMALLSSHAHSHEYLEPNNSMTSSASSSMRPPSTRGGSRSTVSWKKMSSHTGLSMSKTLKRSNASGLSSLLPSLRNSISPRTDDRRSPLEEHRSTSAVAPSGSM